MYKIIAEFPTWLAFTSVHRPCRACLYLHAAPSKGESRSLSSPTAPPLRAAQRAALCRPGHRAGGSTTHAEWAAAANFLVARDLLQAAGGRRSEKKPLRAAHASASSMARRRQEGAESVRVMERQLVAQGFLGGGVGFQGSVAGLAVQPLCGGARIDLSFLSLVRLACRAQSQVTRGRNTPPHIRGRAAVAA